MVAIKKLEKQQEKEDNKHRPGVTMSKPDKPIRTVNVEAGTDNCRDVLHQFRFDARPIADPPKDWYSQRMQIVRTDKLRNPNVSHSERRGWD